jgi:zinc transport system ATP-binding protein
MPDNCASTQAAITFEDVTVTQGGQIILDGVSASVPSGSSTAIVGPNGAGKTTMLLALLGQLPYQGRIRFTCEAEGRCSAIGYVPQRLQFDRGLPMTVLEFMVMGWQRSPLWFGVKANHRDRAMALLKAVKADNLERHRIGALSGGEMQRVLLALALGQKPALLVLDEPAAGVDFRGELLFCDLLEELRVRHGFTQLMVSHDLGTVTHHATHVICLNRKVAAEGPPREVLTEENLAAVFGLHMGLADRRAMPNGNTVCDEPCCRSENDDA